MIDLIAVAGLVLKTYFVFVLCLLAVKQLDSEH